MYKSLSQAAFCHPTIRTSFKKAVNAITEGKFRAAESNESQLFAWCLVRMMNFFIQVMLC